MAIQKGQTAAKAGRPTAHEGQVAKLVEAAQKEQAAIELGGQRLMRGKQQRWWGAPFEAYMGYMA